MNPWIKRGAAGVLGLAGFWLLLRHLRRLLDWPHLYPDLGRLHMGNLVLGGLTLLLTALAWISLVYLFLNRERKLWPQIAAGVSFAVLLLLAGVSMTGAVGDIPCSYTTSLSAYRQEFQTREYIYRGVNLCPFHPEGEISAYARYEKGEAKSERLTVSYEKEQFDAEAARLQAMGLPAIQLEDEQICYEIRQNNVTWQILVAVKTKRVTYSRFQQTEELPDFAPTPTAVTNDISPGRY